MTAAPARSRARQPAPAPPPPPAPDLLHVEQLDASYGHVQVLFGIDLAVREGEVLALLGTNGAGKTTLLRTISGLHPAQRGRVVFDHGDVTGTSPQERVRAGMVQVPGGNAIFPGLSVLENLVVGAWGFVWDRSRFEARLDAVVELFPVLGQRLSQDAGTLSGGERQMLALAKAIMVEPRLLMIDELSLGLAPVVVQELLERVRRLREVGVTLLIVEQSIRVALAVADRAAFIDRGEILFDGPAPELLDRDDLIESVLLGGER